MKSPIFITGAAGFIGFHVSKALIQKKIPVIGIDNLNNYYDVNLKKARINELNKETNNDEKIFKFYNSDIIEKSKLDQIFNIHKPKVVIHLAAQAGVRYSIENPHAYIESNVYGFLNVLENCKKHEVKNLIFASSSSVYGGNTKFPFKETNSVNHPVSLYAATKISNEMMAHSYSHIFNIPCTGLRFFTIYGPWGRPDMAPMIFTKSIFEGTPIQIFNNGLMYRDFTYILEVKEIFLRLIEKPATPNKNFNSENPDPSSSWCPYRIFNVGNGSPIKLLDFISELEKEIGIEAKKEFMEMQVGDVLKTASDTNLLYEWVNYRPNINFKEGIREFIAWYKKFYL